jgi:hypothetical protein
MKISSKTVVRTSSEPLAPPPLIAGILRHIMGSSRRSSACVLPEVREAK